MPRTADAGVFLKCLQRGLISYVTASSEAGFNSRTDNGPSNDIACSKFPRIELSVSMANTAMLRNGYGHAKLLPRVSVHQLSFRLGILQPCRRGIEPPRHLSTTRSSRLPCYRPNSPWTASNRTISLQNTLSYHFVRSITTTDFQPRHRGPVLRFFFRLFAYTGGFILVSGGLVLAFFVYDATTYREDLSYTDIPVSEKALKPRRGGPKNLPIAEVLVDDDDSDAMTRQKHKPKLVILGSGWGSVALLKTLKPEDYHITVVSPVNYFLFTPMLPSATVGTLELRSLVEPVRRIVQRVRGHFLRAEAVEVEFSERLLEVSQTDAAGEKRHFYLPYDKLVIGVGKATLLRDRVQDANMIVGSITNPHGVQGLENCSFLKTIDDARDVRNKVLQNLEHACLPTTSDAERRRLLSFVVCGGGPTGVEFAAELFDLLNEDLGRAFPKILRNEISVHVIQSRGHILNTYDEALSQYAESRFAHDQVEVLTNSRVKEVRPDKIIFTQKDDSGETITKEMPMGFCLWSTGVGEQDILSSRNDRLNKP